MGLQESLGSGEKTASAAILTKSGWITALEVITDGTNDAKVILYDNASAGSGPVIWECTAAGADNYGGRTWDFPRWCGHGIYATLSGTGASYIVEYIKSPER